MTDELEKEKAIKLKQNDTASESIQENESVDNSNHCDIPLNEINISEQYEVLELIGKGGMGTVYKVRDKNLDKIMAVKILKKELADDTAALKRFEQETEAASKLSHPNLVSVYKHGKTVTGEPYLVMDYLDGESLASVIEKEGQLNHDSAIDVFIQVCNALEHAHKNGVIHRDIKPTNIILSKDDTGADVAKIVDFGIAKVMNASTRETHNLTQTGEVFGSPHYMSPEQCLGFMLEEPADIYSLGCSLYETLTGSPPFGGSNPIQLVVKHINDEVDAFEKEFKKNKAGKQLETVTLKCLKKEPEERFQSVAALRADLEAIKAGKNIPKYNIKPKAKPVFTRTHLMAGVAIFMGTFFYSVTGSELLGVGSSNKIANGLISIVFIVCFGSLMHLGIEKFKAIKNNKRSAKNWWIMLLCLSSGLAGLVVVPAILERPLFGYKAPLLFKQIASLGQVLHVFFSLSFIASTIGYFLFKRAKEVSVFNIFIRQFIITLLLVIVPTLLIPQKMAKISDFCAFSLSSSYPEASNFFYGISSQLSSLPNKYARRISENYRHHKRYDEAITTLKEATAKTPSIEEKRNNYLRLAEIYGDLKNRKMAIEYLSKAIDLPSKVKDQGEVYTLYKRANYYYKDGQYQKAIEDFNRCIVKDYLVSDCTMLKIKALIKSENVNKALGLADKLRVNEINEKFDMFLYAVINDAKGNQIKAKALFDKCKELNKKGTRPKEIDKLANQFLDNLQNTASDTEQVRINKLREKYGL